MTLFVAARTYEAQLISFHDGDTCHLNVLVYRDDVFHEEHWRLGFRYRLARCNAPELATPEGVASAAAVQAFAATFPTNGWAITTSKPDPYGRYIVELVTPTGVNVTDWLVANGWAVPVTYKVEEP